MLELQSVPGVLSYSLTCPIAPAVKVLSVAVGMLAAGLLAGLPPGAGGLPPWHSG